MYMYYTWALLEMKLCDDGGESLEQLGGAVCRLRARIEDLDYTTIGLF